MPGSLRVALLVLERELRETLRDPHVLVYFLFPLFLYPLVVWASVQVALLHEGWTEAATWRIDAQGPPEVVARLLEGNEAGTGGLEALRRGDVDVVVRVAERGRALDATVEHVGTLTRSLAAADQVEDRLDDLRAERERALRAEVGLPPALVVRTESTGDDAALFDRVAALLLGLVVPMMSAIAGLYPAIDVVVGERERKTVETTLASPIPRGGLVAGRVAAVTALVSASAVLNAAGLLLTVAQLASTMGEGRGWVPPLATAWALPTLACGSAVVAAVFLLGLLPARTFKEGEYLGSFVMLAALAPPLALLPSLLAEDAPTWQPFVPMANVAWVLARSVTGDVRTWEVLASCAVDLGVAALVTAAVARIVATEGWHFGQHLPPWLGWVRRFLPS